MNTPTSAPVARILTELKGVQSKHGYWIARCPAHEDDKASLSVSVGDDGRALLKCHAGCNAGDVVARLGLQWSDLYAEPLPKRESGKHDPDPSNRQMLVKSYDYVDEHGQLLYQACRFEPKTFRQRRPDGNGDWIYDLKGVRRVLYRLPEVMEAVALGRTVYVVEGEKDADALVALGYCATTNAMGAGKWHDSYSATLTGADVAVLPDNDKPGKEHAERIARELGARGATVRVVQLPELPQKGDVSDWLAMGHGPVELEAIVQRTAPWQPADGESVLPHAIRALDAPEPRPIEWIVTDVFTAGEIGLLVGDGGSFKSTAAINMAAAIAGGYAVWDRFQVRQRSVLIISAEDSMDVVLMRLNAFVEGHGWDRTRVLGNLHLFATTDVTLSSAIWQQHIIDEAKRIDAGMIILDPFAELIQGDENSNSEIRPIVKFLRALGRQTNAAVVVVHHAGKQGQDKRTLDRIRGASALPSAARSILFFDFQPNGAGVAVEHLKMSRTPRLERFILARDVRNAPDNKAQWTSAKLAHTEVKAADESRAITFVMSQVSASPRQLSTSDLKRIGNKNRLRGEDIGSALNSLLGDGKIGFEPGPRGARKWYPIGYQNAQQEVEL